MASFILILGSGYSYQSYALNFENNRIYATDTTIKQTPYSIEGKLFNKKTHKKIIGATISINNYALGNSDTSGKYHIVIPDNIITEQNILQISCIGYEDIKDTLSKTAFPLTKNYKLGILVIGHANAQKSIVVCTVSREDIVGKEDRPDTSGSRRPQIESR